MVTLFGILDIGARGLFAQQRALNTTGHNIANATTPGYSRQRVNMVSAYPLLERPGPLGTGVEVVSVERMRDAFLDGQIRTQLSLFGFFSTASGGYDQLETILAEPLNPVAGALDNPEATGLNAILQRFFDAFHELSLSPESSSARTSVVQTAITATETFNNLAQQLAQQRRDTNDAIKLKIDEINLKLQEIADLNRQIARIEVDGQSHANDLRDKRDQALADLSQMTPLRTTENPDGSVNVAILGVNVISGVNLTTTLEAVVTPDDPNAFYSVVFSKERSRVLNTLFESGELGALLALRDDITPRFQERLDTLAAALIEQVNRLHAGGSGLSKFTLLRSLNGVSSASVALANAGLPASINAGQFQIVVEDANGVAQGRYNIALDPGVDTLASLAAAIDAADGVVGGGPLSAQLVGNQLEISSASGLTFRFEGDTSGVLGALGLNTFFTGTDATTIAVAGDIVANPSRIAHSADGTPGNVDNAIAIAQLAGRPILDNGTADFRAYNRSTLSILGIESRRVSELALNTDALVTELAARQESLAGVSLDEEAVNLIRFQQAFNGSARFITAVDQMIDNVVNGMGLVGIV